MFRIRFQGLLTHALINGDQLVVVYNEPGHQPLITANDSDILGTQGPVFQGAGVSCMQLFGNMELKFVERGPVLTALGGIPSLGYLADGTHVVRNEILYRRPHPDFAGYLELEGGVLTVENWYEQHVTFDGGGLQCLGRTILFSTTPIGNRVRLSMENDTYWIDLAPHSDVWITNIDIGGMNPTDEYQTYKNFFTDATTIKAPNEHPTSPCPYGSTPPPRPKCGTPGTLGVQCSNNLFP